MRIELILPGSQTSVQATTLRTPLFGAQGGTRTHDFTDLQSATLAALSPVHIIGAGRENRTR